MDIKTSTINVYGLNNIGELTKVLIDSLIKTNDDGKIIFPTIDDKWNIIRSVRNDLLQQCDWTQLPDVSLTNEQKLAWSQYRQMLRNVTEDFTNPDDVIFPEAPNG